MTMDIISTFVLSVVQGITAWIPISSKTQVLIVANYFFGISFATAIAFALILHIGDLLAAIVRYRQAYFDAIISLKNPNGIINNWNNQTEKQSGFLVISLIATVIVALPLYLLTKKIFSKVNGAPLLFAAGLLLVVMAIITYFANKKEHSQWKEIGIVSSIITGIAQGFAVIPGISRSGITQSALLAQGIEPDKAMKFSFMMSAPMIFAAIVAYYFVSGFAGISISFAILGIIISALFSFLTMDVLTKLASKVKPYYFLAAIGILSMIPFAISLFFKVG